MSTPRGPQPVSIQLTDRQRAILEEIVRCRHSPQYEVTRATIILKGDSGARNHAIAHDLDTSEVTVRTCVLVGRRPRSNWQKQSQGWTIRSYEA